MYFHYLPLEKDMALHLKKLESPSPNDALYKLLYSVIVGMLIEKYIPVINTHSSTISVFSPHLAQTFFSLAH